MAARGLAARCCLLAAAALVCACTVDNEPAATTTVVDLNFCVATLAASDGKSAAECPAFLATAVTEAWEFCRESGGRLGAVENATVWSIDVNDDRRPEQAFEYNDVVYCENAWSAFECGSRGCPKILYGERDGAWQSIGAISASAREALELAGTKHADGYRDLTVGCASGEDCAERWHYVWRGGYYEAASVEVRGYPVDFANSVHGLHALVADTTLLATPRADGAALERHSAGTEVDIIGTAEAADYYYVSPCNACASGFVPRTALPPLLRQ
jgi:hypothetical protein